ncbi:DUF4167 domain-containing protein [Alphaproteobacteria bacterium KMM 3653]|uniref:DUF4167 domain-containing protein n=1 Tax=Harenicola maris TaxID=2841044 RepID=A0AAP2G6R8_9RHOB|nr:DUF4167 domain-containing protein [Harenicola maris]
MRSSKSRSRNKNNNRSRSVGNVVNRVFDSSGPEGKVRGTPQQIIDKYGQLARDAQLSGDRVATENFQQHAEHYLRLLSEAQREQDARREQQEAQHQQNQGNQQGRQGGGDGGQQGGQNGGQNGGNNGGNNGGQQPAQDAPKPAEKAASPVDLQGSPQPDVADVIDVADGGSEESGLVETPESKPAPKRRAPRKPRKPKAAAEGTSDDGPKDATDTAAE